MSDVRGGVHRFGRRVRLLRAWRGLAIGALFGGAAGVALAGLDFYAVRFTTWTDLGIVLGVCAAIGVLIGIMLPLSAATVAAVMDRRAGLKDRLATALEREGQESEWDELQRADASRCADALRPSRVFPVRVGRWQIGALATCLLAAAIYFVGSSGLMFSGLTQAEKQKVETTADGLERVARALQKPESDPTDAQQALAAAMQRAAQELRRGRLNEKEALQRLHELEAQAANLIKERVERAREGFQGAEALKERMEKAALSRADLTKAQLKQMEMTAGTQELFDDLLRELDLDTRPSGLSEAAERALNEVGIEKLDPRLMELSDQQRKAMEEAIEQMTQATQERLQDEGLTESEREALKKQLEELKELSRALKISEEAKRALKELMNSDEMKELRKLMAKMAKSAEGMEAGKPPTEEEIKELERALEELAKQWKDPETREQILAEIRKAIEELKAGKLTMAQCKKLGFGLGMGAGMAGGGPGSQPFFPDAGSLNKSDEEFDEIGKANPVPTRGVRDPDSGEESYIEILAPTRLGDRASVPYQEVLPRYGREAEEAIRRERIPKEHQRRVREYFESIKGGKGK